MVMSEFYQRRTFRVAIVFLFLCVCFSVYFYGAYFRDSPYGAYFDHSSFRWDKLTATSRQTNATGKPNTGYFDFENMKPINFARNYKNPCWRGNAKNGPIKDDRLHCVPYFYILGVMKCGTSDLWQRLSKHPEIESPGFKEAQWFAHGRLRARGKKDPRKLGFFVKLYDRAALEISRHPSILPNGTTYHTHVTCDGSPSNIYFNDQWRLTPGNEGLDEPKLTNLHCIKRLYPAAKVIITFRDPVDRLYSDYLFRFRHRGTPTRYEFHQHVVMAISTFLECVKTYTMRRCIYDKQVWEKKAKFRLELGFYAFYMTEILNVFDETNVLTLLLSHYHSNLHTELLRVIKFLGLSKPSDTVLQEMTSLHIYNSKAYIRQRTGNMLNKTRHILEEFYRPFNQEMAEFMNDERYLFRKKS